MIAIVLIPVVIVMLIMGIPVFFMLTGRKVARRIHTPTTGSLENQLGDVPFTDSRDPILHARYRDQLKGEIERRKVEPLIRDIEHRTVEGARAEIRVPRTPPSPFTIPVHDRLKDTGQTVAQVIKYFQSDEVQQYRVFPEIREQLNRNVYEASGLKYPSDGKLINPWEYKGRPKDIVKAYLGYTPMQHWFDERVPFPFTDEHRFEHMHLIGGTGHGKSQTLQHIIHHDLMRPDPPSLVVIDSQGDMLWKLQNLKYFVENDRLIVIDPQYNPALNIFDMKPKRIAGYSPIFKEQIEAGIVELYHYMFGAIASDMTSKQGTAFVFVVRLMLSIDGATLHTLLELMEDQSKTAKESPFYPYTSKLDPTARTFFENQFFNKQAFGQTKQQLARRLYAILSVPAFNRSFAATKNKLDMFDALQSGKVVLVNTSKALLKTDASALFGRYMIALTMAAAFERAATADRHPAFLIIDEAADYFDESLESLLTQARKYKLGVLFAHQHMSQLTPDLKSSVAANTTIKFAGGVSDQDAHTLDADMRTTHDFITSVQKRGKSTEFAAYIRNETRIAVKVEVPFGTLEAAPIMMKEEHAALIQRNNDRYSSRDFPQKTKTPKMPDVEDENIAPSTDY